MALSSSEDEDEDETPPAKKIKIEPEANTAAVADRVEVFKTEHPADHTFEEEEEEGPGDGMVVDLENEGYVPFPYFSFLSFFPHEGGGRKG